MAKTWKAVERAIAKRLDGGRIPCVGRPGPDVLTGWLSIEVKTRKRLPAWLQDAMKQAIDNCWGDRFCIVVLHETGQRHDNDLVICRLQDFERWVCPLFEGMADGQDAISHDEGDAGN